MTDYITPLRSYIGNDGTWYVELDKQELKLKTMNKEQAQERIKAIENELAELKKVINEPEKVGRYGWLNHGVRYFRIDSDGDISIVVWCNDGLDNQRLSIGNVYQTEAEAQHEVDRRKLIEEMKNDSTDLFGKFSIYYETNADCWFYGSIIGQVQFKTRQEAHQAFTKYKDRLHLLLPFGFNVNK